jgi:hypothetical protein
LANSARGAASAAILTVGVAAPRFAGGLQNGGSIGTPLSGLNG